MIIATAGHVDHGKTSLVKMLTGVDTDRLPEEKRRAMTIDLGFAYLPTDLAEPIGFVDVPGHERFIHNMLCGLAGIDFVLFVVAADDGPMPQTHEHLAILDLLGVRNGAVAITKIDRVAAGRVAEVEAQIATLLAATSLANAPAFPVSASSGDGIEELREHLQNAARDCPARAANGNFRMTVDRCFTIAGAGLVVTGTAVSGSVAVGDQITALLAGISARVRNIHAQNTQSDTARAGQRCALNLAGAELRRGLLARGDWIVTGDTPPTRKLDAELRVLQNEARPLAHWTPVHVHLGAADVLGRVAVLEGPSIAAGRSGLVQLVLDRPIGSWHGDHLIVRDQSAQRTIGGGRVIDVFPPARGRAKPDRLAYLRAVASDDSEGALASALEIAAGGLDLHRFAANRNLGSEEARRLFARVPMRSIATDAGLMGFSRGRWDRLKRTALDLLAAWHRRSPDTFGPNEDRIFAGTEVRLAREAILAVAAELEREGAIVRQGTAVRLPSHHPALKPAQAALWKQIAPLLDGLRPPAVAEIAAAVGENPNKIESLLKQAARQGLLVQVAPNRFFRPSTLRRLGEIVASLARESQTGLVTAAAFRDRSGIGRNLAIEVLEHFDHVKFTRRAGDARKVLRPVIEAFGVASSGADV